MATQSYIIDKETAIIGCQLAVNQALDALQIEINSNRRGELPGHVNPENRDCWQTLNENANIAFRKLRKLIDALDDAL